MDEGWIDVHHHAYHPRLVAELAAGGIRSMAPGVPVPQWRAADSLAVMDRWGIGGAVLSVLLPDAVLHHGHGLVRRANEWTAQLVGDHPGRFCALACLPLPDVGATLATIDHAFDDLGMNGVVVGTPLPGGRLLADPEFVPVLTELNRRHAVVFIHPNPGVGCVCAANGGAAIPPPLVDFVVSTTRGVLDLVYRGSVQRHPHIRFLLAHAGGMLPYLLERLELAQVWVAGGNPNATADSVRRTLARFYYEVAQSAWPGALECLGAVTDQDHILFGSDFPFMPDSVVGRTRAAVIAQPGLCTEQVARAGALTLFPGFAS
ncbi:amidohydrolase family protein [Nocardiopsis ansamitocini]|uniref:Amidohydrolase n=1 Tax=Nocardiopsis ansamitocini TaxID=1670832 RepID=A0A9W6UJM5_9ACTN|nr:amidohydrolase family protein [Nocardiopsis ansamitocini]GLU48215.1 amidohydrolase [Nocardiopsis ansamitocini]